MEVLFVTVTLPYPPNSGATTRTFHLIKRLSIRHRIHLVAYADPSCDEDKIAFFEKSCASVTTVPWRETKQTPYFYLELLLNLLSGVPLIVSRFTKPAMARAVQRIMETRKIDLICCDFITLSRNLPPGNGRPTLLTVHNVESSIWKRYLRYEKNPLRAFYIYLQYRKIIRFEGRILRDFKQVACVSEADLEQLKSLCPSPNYKVVPNGVDLEYFRPIPELRKPFRLVFTGAMDWRPNQDAVRFFLSQVYHRIKQVEPRTSFLIVGREPPAGLRSMAAVYDDVSIVGTVSDIRPYLASGAVYVVPMRIGGGTRLKILEAMAMGQPVVSTSVGCEGLAVVSERDLLVADSPQEFAQAVLRIFNDHALAARIGQAGADLIQKTYGWNQIAGNLDKILHEMAFDGNQ